MNVDWIQKWMAKKEEVLWRIHTERLNSTGLQSKYMKKEVLYLGGVLAILKNKRWSMYGRDRSNSKKLCGISNWLWHEPDWAIVPFYLMSFNYYSFPLFFYNIDYYGRGKCDGYGCM